ncbi:MAG: PilZ domain-containing protein [candidate division Zixibacteria bacterium]|nr:PilZ domain-containing protein [candidate division Zixibacteria bacterium]
MKTNEKTRHVQDVAAEENMIKARRPFKVTKEDQRRFIRLEISSPMSMKKLKDVEGNYWSEGDWHIINGMILNISAGGVLVDLDQAVDEGDVVSMHFTIQDVEGIENVLGLVKRSDCEPDGCLAGIEFITRDYLMDQFSHAELELMGDDYTNFNTSVTQVLERYVERQSSTSGGA